MVKKDKKVVIAGVRTLLLVMVKKVKKDKKVVIAKHISNFSGTLRDKIDFVPDRPDSSSTWSWPSSPAAASDPLN
jgi:hypothetical protein